MRSLKDWSLNTSQFFNNFAHFLNASLDLATTEVDTGAILLNTTFLSYWYTQRAVTARRHFQNGGYMALLEAKTGLLFCVAQNVLI